MIERLYARSPSNLQRLVAGEDERLASYVLGT
jgi:hypothetical protein